MAENDAQPAASKRKSSAKPVDMGSTEVETTSAGTSEARTRFDSALDEAKAGIAALGAEARERAAGYTSQAKVKGTDYAGQAKAKASELAIEGKTRASEALTGLAKLVEDNAPAIDEKVGSQYGDYARTASQTLKSTATKLDSKSVEELGEDAREFVRKSPGTAVALAGLAGFFFARLFRGK